MADHPRSGSRILFTWQTTGGHILEGQNTRKILLDTSGVDEQAITVIVEMAEISGHVAATSCVVKLVR